MLQHISTYDFQWLHIDCSGSGLFKQTTKISSFIHSSSFRHAKRKLLAHLATRVSPRIWLCLLPSGLTFRMFPNLSWGNLALRCCHRLVVFAATRTIRTSETSPGDAQLCQLQWAHEASRWAVGLNPALSKFQKPHAAFLKPGCVCGLLHLILPHWGMGLQIAILMWKTKRTLGVNFIFRQCYQ